MGISLFSIYQALQRALRWRPSAMLHGLAHYEPVNRRASRTSRRHLRSANARARLLVEHQKRNASILRPRLGDKKHPNHGKSGRWA